MSKEEPRTWLYKVRIFPLIKIKNVLDCSSVNFGCPLTLHNPLDHLTQEPPQNLSIKVLWLGVEGAVGREGGLLEGELEGLSEGTEMHGLQHFQETLGRQGFNRTHSFLSM